MLAYQPVFVTLLRDAIVLAYVDLEPATVRWVERFQRLLAGPDAPLERQVRPSWLSPASVERS